MVAIESFRKFASDYGRATMAGDEKATNALYDKIKEVAQQIAESGAHSEYYSCLDADDDYVRLWASVELLATDSIRATEVLRHLATKQTPAGFDAKMTLKEFDAGRLHL